LGIKKQEAHIVPSVEIKKKNVRLWRI